MLNIKKFIDDNKINQTALCEVLGITRSTLYNWIAENDDEKNRKIVNAINDYARQMYLGDMKDFNFANNTLRDGNEINISSKNNPTDSTKDILERENELLRKRIDDLEEIIKLLKNQK